MGDPFSKPLDTVLDTYRVGSADHLSDQGVVFAARQAKRALSRSLMPVDLDRAHRKVPDTEFLISRKIDGEFNVLVVDQDTAYLANPGGTVRQGLPLLEEAATKLATPARTILAGELYWAPPDGHRERIHDVVRLARRPRDKGDLDNFCFAAFDIIEHNGTLVDTLPLEERWQILSDLLSNTQSVHPVEALWGRRKAVFDHFASWVETEGSEGLVIRSDTAGGFKLKQRHTIDLVVIGFSLGSDERAQLLHDLLVAVMRPDASFQVAGHVGGGFSDDERASFPDLLQPLACASSYIETNSDRVAYTMIEPEWVIEVSCLDVLTETSAGLVINRMVLDYDDQRTRWSPARRMPLGSLIAPQFVRRRTDKAAHPDDVSIRQLTALKPIERAEATAEDLTLPKSEILQRTVYEKILSGNHMVRKAVLWKTNKEGLGDFPAYVLYTTDFSQGRKIPLTRDIKVSNDRSQLESLYETTVAGFNKRGWSRVDDTES